MGLVKNKLATVVGTFGGLCALCCTFPILGILGFGSFEAIFCENETLRWLGILIAVGAFGYLLYTKFLRSGCSSNYCVAKCSCGTSKK